jgi:NADH:ubiquinone oxidoreductase subunit 4 (subunit M)
MPAGPLLSILIFLPAIGAIALLFLRSDDHEWIRRLAFSVSLVEFIFSVWWFLSGVPTSGEIGRAHV